jgi:hypothetical protein
MTERGKWQGMITIARLNWPYYAAAAVMLVLSAWGLTQRPKLELGIICGFALAGAVYFLFVSLAISHVIYDRSDLYRWGWLERALRGAKPTGMVFCHCGFDEASRALRERFGNIRWLALDHFDETRMTEASIRRARRMFAPAPGTVPAKFDRWPAEAAGADVIFGLLAIHELRSEAEREAWFLEAKRCLTPGGRVVLTEHTRDFANFLAFGPGFVHFHSRASWRRSWERAGFNCLDEFKLTPWIRVFVIATT